MSGGRKSNTAIVGVVGGIFVLLVLFLSTIWIGRTAQRDTESAVRAVSLLYLDELAGRREQVVENNLQRRTRDLDTAVSLMTDKDLADMESLQDYQARMKKLYTLDKFAFVDSEGLIYTSLGTRTNIGDYSFDYRTLKDTEISVLNPEAQEKKAIIAMPVDIAFMDQRFTVCFMEIDMKELLSGVSMESDENDSTFCNIYTSDGIALSNTVLGGLAVENNLLEALKKAEFEDDYSYENVISDFSEGVRGEVSFSYNGIRETLSYVPVKGTNWFLTYLIRESVISGKISSISDGILQRSIIQSLMTVALLLLIFAYVIFQVRRNSRLTMEKEKAEAANLAKQQEYEERLLLQEKLLEEEKYRRQQDNMITAMASDYRSVYHVDLDTDLAVCYRADPEYSKDYKEGDQFPYYKTFKEYAGLYVDEAYREGFLHFIEPESIRQGLQEEPVLAYRYLARHDNREYYEMIRAAGVEHGTGSQRQQIHAVGIGLTVIDTEMRQSMAQQKALSEALAQAEEANKAKTAFLSSMSHEIRTPMNAIIGLDTIALNDPETPERTREYLEKIGASAEHLLSLINDILDMSRIESGRMILKQEEFSFRKFLEAINTMFSAQAQDRGQDYRCYMKSEVDDYYIGDNMKLRQILINILGNAVKFTPEGGSVVFEVERKARFEGRTTLQFTVKDTGIGMSREFLPRLFDAFSQEDISSTSRYGSSGLGMAITKNLVEMMNGTITVDSLQGQGTTFVVAVTLDDSSRKDGNTETDEIRPEEMEVLVIDDDPVACAHAKLVFEKAGITVETAGSGKEAIELVKLRHARMVPYNLILIDWQMPEMDGIETTREIRSLTGDETAIIILTAYNWDDIREEAMEAGVDSIIPKPLFAGVALEEFRSARKKKNLAVRDRKKKTDLTGRRILVAEDVEINAEIIDMILRTRDMIVDLAENGKVAVDKFASHPENYYDAVLMDMRMPEMDGLTATRNIRAMGRNDAASIPIIALTANAFDEDVQRSLQAGLNAHLSKPVEPDALFETLEELIKE